MKLYVLCSLVLGLHQIFASELPPNKRIKRSSSEDEAEVEVNIMNVVTDEIVPTNIMTDESTNPPPQVIPGSHDEVIFLEQESDSEENLGSGENSGSGENQPHCTCSFCSGQLFEVGSDSDAGMLGGQFFSTRSFIEINDIRIPIAGSLPPFMLSQLLRSRNSATQTPGSENSSQNQSPQNGAAAGQSQASPPNNRSGQFSFMNMGPPLGLFEFLDLLTRGNGSPTPDHPFNSGFQCPCEALEKQSIKDIDEWKSTVNMIRCNTLPVIVSRRNIVMDATRSYKSLVVDHPNQLFHRNIKVQFEDEAGVDMGGLRGEFFNLYFTAILEESGIFEVNSEGFVKLREDVPLTPELLDALEAFGFFLAKSWQNNIPIGRSLSLIFLKFLKNADLSCLCNLNSFRTWDPVFTLGLTRLLTYSDSELAEFTFDSIDSAYEPVPVQYHTVFDFISLKMHDKLRSKFQVQLLMFALGFFRACPADLLLKYDLSQLEKEFVGEPVKFSRKDFTRNVDLEVRSRPVWVWFSKLLFKFSEEDLELLFRFITGKTRLPFGGIDALTPPISIKLFDTNPDSKLPFANSCSHVLYLPAYSCSEVADERFSTFLRLLRSREIFGFGLA